MSKDFSILYAIPQKEYERCVQTKGSTFPAVKTVKVNQLNINDANKITANQNSASDALLPTKRRLVKASIPDTKLAPPSPLPTEKNLLPTTNDTTDLLPPAPPSLPLLPTLPSTHLPSQTVIAPPNRVHTIHQPATVAQADVLRNNIVASRPVVLQPTPLKYNIDATKTDIDATKNNIDASTTHHLVDLESDAISTPQDSIYEGSYYDDMVGDDTAGQELLPRSPLPPLAHLITNSSDFFNYHPPPINNVLNDMSHAIEGTNFPQILQESPEPTAPTVSKALEFMTRNLAPVPRVDQDVDMSETLQLPTENSRSQLAVENMHTEENIEEENNQITPMRTIATVSPPTYNDYNEQTSFIPVENNQPAIQNNQPAIENNQLAILPPLSVSNESTSIVPAASQQLSVNIPPSINNTTQVVPYSAAEHYQLALQQQQYQQQQLALEQQQLALEHQQKQEQLALEQQHQHQLALPFSTSDKTLPISYNSSVLPLDYAANSATDKRLLPEKRSRYNITLPYSTRRTRLALPPPEDKKELALPAPKKQLALLGPPKLTLPDKAIALTSSKQLVKKPIARLVKRDDNIPQHQTTPLVRGKNKKNDLETFPLIPKKPLVLLASHIKAIRQRQLDSIKAYNRARTMVNKRYQHRSKSNNETSDEKKKKKALELFMSLENKHVATRRKLKEAQEKSGKKRRLNVFAADDKENVPIIDLPRKRK